MLADGVITVLPPDTGAAAFLAGLLENKELAEEMVEIERRQEVLVGILRDIASEHPEVRDIIMQRLSAIAKQNEVVTIVSESISEQ